MSQAEMNLSESYEPHRRGVLRLVLFGAMALCLVMMVALIGSNPMVVAKVKATVAGVSSPFARATSDTVDVPRQRNQKPVRVRRAGILSKN
jgi:hypothetical protein